MPPVSEAALRLQLEEMRARREVLGELRLPDDIAFIRYGFWPEGDGGLRWGRAEIRADGAATEVLEFPIPPAQLAATGLPSLAGYSICLYGVLSIWGAHIHPGAPDVWMLPLKGASDLLRLRATVRSGDDAVYAELRWHPTGDPPAGPNAGHDTVTLHGLEYGPTDVEIQRALGGRALLVEVAQRAGGRPRKTGKRHRLTVAGVMAAYAEIVDDEDRGWKEPSIQDVADRLGGTPGDAPMISKSTLDRWLREEKRYWPPTGWREWPAWRAQRDPDGVARE